jgi:hypothetical protein
MGRRGGGADRWRGLAAGGFRWGDRDSVAAFLGLSDCVRADSERFLRRNTGLLGLEPRWN